eukprot:maker-scaffold_55-snap-gene-0.47-mRNA-1 protein AED:0.10 eAED:0.10 QI:42/1/1/1/1/1/4/24/785
MTEKPVFRTFHSPAGTDQDLRKTWPILRDAIRDIFGAKSNELSFEVLYRTAYHLVLYGEGEFLYNKIKSELDHELKSTVKKLKTSSDTSFLLDVKKSYYEFKHRLRLIKDVFMYMDKNFVEDTDGLKVTFNLGLECFYRMVVKDGVLNARIRQTLISNIEAEREGKDVMRERMRDVLSMLIEVGLTTNKVYVEEFEDVFLEGSKKHFSALADEKLENCDMSTYLRFCKKQIELEESKVRRDERFDFSDKEASEKVYDGYLSVSTKPKLLKIIRNELLENNVPEIIESETGCVLMFEKLLTKDLGLMYELFLQLDNAVSVIKKAFSEFIEKDCMEILSSYDGDKKALSFVKRLLEKKRNYDRLVKESFQGDKEFRKCLRESFQNVINSSDKTVHFVSLYIDHLMKSKIKSGQNVAQDVQFEETLDQLVSIFNHLNDRDIFEDYYKQLLAKRLLTKKKDFTVGFSRLAEEMMISKLKAESGSNFTLKLEKMIKDLSSSEEETVTFKEAIHSGNYPDIEISSLNLDLLSEFEIIMLTDNSWPKNETQKCELPREIEESIIKPYELYYKKKFPKKVLKWQTNLGHAEVLWYVYPENKAPQVYSLVVSTFQMVLLALFSGLTSSDEFLTYETILNKTSIPEVDLKRHLVSLVAPKFQILKKEPKGKFVENTDKFSINDEFISKAKRVRIPLISARTNFDRRKKGEKEVSILEVSPRIMEERLTFIEAAIVRIMKARKEIKQDELEGETLRQLSSKFKPTVQDIRKRIEELIKRDYMERDENDRKLFKYVA